MHGTALVVAWLEASARLTMKPSEAARTAVTQRMKVRRIVEE
jgi:hypothetical protein